jgi:hypothetical protein
MSNLLFCLTMSAPFAVITFFGVFGLLTLKRPF